VRRRGPLLLYALVRVFVVRVRLPLALNALLAAGVTAAAAWALPPLMARAMGRADLNASLMKTFFDGVFLPVPADVLDAADHGGSGHYRYFPPCLYFCSARISSSLGL
jgi:hypothetical protein